MATTILVISCVFSPKAKTVSLAASISAKTFLIFSAASCAAAPPACAAVLVAVAVSAAEAAVCALDWMDFRDSYPTKKAGAVESVREAWRDRPSLAASRPHA